jgi:hypothetical protein
MKSTEFLQAAIDVQAERGVTYDKPSGERSMGATVTAFNAITGRDLSEAEGWLLLQTLKDVRQWQNPSKYHHDSALDGVAYSALKAEALSEEQVLVRGRTLEECANPLYEQPSHIISDIPSWDDAPEWAKWLSLDQDGAHWFETEPVEFDKETGEFGFMWPDDGRCELIDPDPRATNVKLRRPARTAQ